MDWNHKDLWRMSGPDFMVEVSRHTEQPSSYMRTEEGPNRWAVYAYVYPKHPHFKRFAGREMFQEAASGMPLHCGPSFLHWHYNDDGEPTSVQVGADYHHLYDEHFTHYASRDDAFEVFQDAERLHAWLKECE